MSFLKVSDSELFRIYDEDPAEAIGFFRIKYESEIKKVSTVYEFYNNSSYTDADFIRDIQQLSTSFNKEQTKKISFNAVGDFLNTKMDTVLEIIYNGTFQEIDFARFKEYFLMVEGKEPEELERMQMARFNYIGRPLLDERDQIYDSLLILEHYIFDINSNEIVYSPEELGYINGTITEIKDLVSENRIDQAKIKLVSLQIIMGLDVRFYSTLKYILDNYLSLRKIVNASKEDFNIDEDKDNGLGNPRKKGPIK